VKLEWTFRRTAIAVVASVLSIVVIVGVVIDASGRRSPPRGGAPPVSSVISSTRTSSIPTVKVPNLVGLGQAQIGNVLPGGLTVTNITLVSGTRAAGTVLSQHPRPGSRVKQYASVRISVSTGKAGSGTAAQPIPAVPGQCGSGNVTFVTLTTLAGPICLDVGARLTVTFVSSSSTELTGYGRWSNELPTVSDESVLNVGPYGFSGTTATAMFTAVGAGTATATAYFGVNCASALTTPCTIPPMDAEQTITVKVVAPA
jgi:hypothetical protein